MKETRQKNLAVHAFFPIFAPLNGDSVEGGEIVIIK